MNGRCFICGATVESGSSLCSDACESRAIDRQAWAGKVPCIECLDKNAKDPGHEVNPVTAEDGICETCQENRNELAYERYIDNFYGGSR